MLRIDKQKCNGCSNLKEGPKCVTICPGDLLFLDKDNKSGIYDKSECWDCCACIKECPRSALSMTLPFQINESRTELKGRCLRTFTRWDIASPDGTQLKRFEIESRTEAKGNTG